MSLDRDSSGWRALAEIEPDLPSGGWSFQSISGRVITLEMRDVAFGPIYKVNYLWDGTKFLRLTEDRMDGGGRRIG